MKFEKTIAFAFAAALFWGATGCMSMEQMLASKDEDIHGWGEDMAVTAITDKASEKTLPEKLNLVEQIHSQIRLAKIYVGVHTPPEVKQAIVSRITDKDAFLYALANHKNDDDARTLISSIKTDEARLGAANALLMFPTDDNKKIADEIMSTFKNDKLLGEYLCQQASLIDDLRRSHRQSDQKRYILEEKAFELMVDYIQTSKTTYDVEFSVCGNDKLEDKVKKRRQALEDRDEKIRLKEWKRRQAIEKEKERKREAEKQAMIKMKTEEFKNCLTALRPTEDDIAKLKEKAATFKGNTLVMKGFYLGMPIDDAKTLIWGASGDVKAKAKWKADDNVTNEVMTALGGIVSKTENGIKLSDGSILANEKGEVTRIGFSRNRVDALFGVKGVNGKMFCRQLLDSYDDIKELDYSSVEVEDAEARDRYLNRAAMNAFMSGNAGMAFRAGLNSPDFKKWVGCYHCESKKGWKLKVFAEAKGDETFLVLEKTQTIEMKNFD